MICCYFFSAPRVKRRRTPIYISRFECDFQTDNSLCGLQQSNDDEFDWTRHRGKTLTKRTGPTTDKSHVCSLKTSLPGRIISELQYAIRIKWIKRFQFR